MSKAGWPFTRVGVERVRRRTAGRDRAFAEFFEVADGRIQR